MLKPFYNKKKNIDDRLVPAVTAADAGKVLGVTEEGKIAPVEAGGGKLYQHLISFHSNGTCSIINTDPTPFTKETLINFLRNGGFTSSSNYYPLFTYSLISVTGGGNKYLMETFGLFAPSDSALIYLYRQTDVATFVSSQDSLQEYSTITDHVIAL